MNNILKKLPGIILCVIIARLGVFLAELLGKDLLGFTKSPISPIMLAIILGIVIRNIFYPAIFSDGTQFSLKFILRLGIVLLGIRLSIFDIFQLGVVGLPLVAICIIAALLFTSMFSNLLKVTPKMGTLIAVGSSICGATAIVATAPLIKAEKEEVTYAIANITIFGIIAMLFYPYLAQLIFKGSETAIGLFLGTSVHETAQVAGAGLIYGQLFGNEAVLDTATLTKLIRNSFMVIVIPFLAYRFSSQKLSGENKIKLSQAFPIFIIGFILFAIIRTLGDFIFTQQSQDLVIFNASSWQLLITEIKKLAELCLTVAMAAIGLNTNLKQLRNLGIKPFYVGLAAALTVGIASLLLIFILQSVGAIV